MKKRKEVVKYIETIDGLCKDVGDKDSGCFHFGIIDLRLLLDFIYEGKPKKDNEKLNDIGY